MRRGPQRILRQRGIERRFDHGDAVAIMRDHFGEAFRAFDIAQEPDDAVEQQILDRGIKVELQLAGNPVVEIVNGAIERGHAVAVAHRGKG